ncbi:MAG: SDR family oxidoreductase [Xanthobacteraceae bacterium]
MASGDKELAGKVAVVTGSGRNIGKAIALALAEGGAAVVVNARSNRTEADAVVREIEAAGGKAAAVIGDVADPATAKNLAAAAERLGRLDFLVNNAAIRREKPLDQMTFEEWREVHATILDGAFLCVQASLPLLRKSGAGAIVNIGGMSAHAGSKHRVHVVTAKSALVGFSKALAHDLAADKVTVNCLSPGLIKTAREAGAAEPQHHQIHATLTGGRGKPEDVAATVRFLCGPGARYITGQTIHVNGGAYLP